MRINDIKHKYRAGEARHYDVSFLQSQVHKVRQSLQIAAQSTWLL